MGLSPSDIEKLFLGRPKVEPGKCATMWSPEALQRFGRSVERPAGQSGRMIRRRRSGDAEAANGCLTVGEALVAAWQSAEPKPTRPW